MRKHFHDTIFTFYALKLMTVDIERHGRVTSMRLMIDKKIRDINGVKISEIQSRVLALITSNHSNSLSVKFSSKTALN